jgi:hypothetical protein
MHWSIYLIIEWFRVEQQGKYLFVSTYSIGYRISFSESKRKINIQFVFFIVEKDEEMKLNIYNNTMFKVL